MTGLLLSLLMLLAPTRTEAPKFWEPLCAPQVATMRSLAPEVAYSGRRFGGKSNVGCAKALLYALSYPGARVAITRLERRSMDNTTLLTLRTEIVPSDMWAQCWRDAKSSLYLPNGSQIDVFGLDDPGRQMGSRYGFMAVDQAEQLDYNRFQLANSSVMQAGMPWHQLLLLFNPENPEHWAYKRYAPDDGDGPRYDENGRHFADVIHVMPDDLMEHLSAQSVARLDSLDGVWRLRYRLGQWAAFTGSVYGDLWNPAVHAPARPPEWDVFGGYPPPDWPRYRGIDFGFQAPSVCSWFAEDGDGVMWRYRLLYETGLTGEDLAKRIRDEEDREVATLKASVAAMNGSGERFGSYVHEFNHAFSACDPASPDKRMTLAREGIYCAPAENDILEGIECVRKYLASGRLRFVQGALLREDATLLKDKKPHRFEKEQAGYRWQKDRASAAAAGPRDLPVKGNDHECDAVRYALKTREGAPVPGVYA